MIKTVYKYPLLVANISGEFDVLSTKVPASHRIVHLGLDPVGQTCIWCEVDPDAAPDTELDFIRVGTGWTIDLDIFEYVNTIFQDIYVWHFYVKKQ